MAALLVSAPGGFDITGLHGIHPDDSGPQVLDDPQAAENVARPDCGRQAIRCVVRDLQGVILILEWNACDDGTENLFASDPRLVVRLKNRGLDEVSLLQFLRRGAAAAAHESGFLAADLDVALY